MPEDKNIPDYYEILGINYDADTDSVKKAFRSLAKAFHPDTSTHPNARERFLKITDAWEILSDPKKRREYDEKLNLKVEFQRDSEYKSNYNNQNKGGFEKSDFNSDSKKSTCGFFAENDDIPNSESKGDEYSIMADYEFYSDETEFFLINGEKKSFENARHIIVNNTEYIIDGDEMIDIGDIERFLYDGSEKYLIDGVEYEIINAEHYYQGGCEYVVINGRPYRIKIM